MMSLFPGLSATPDGPGYLRWDLGGSIRHDDPSVGGCRVEADVWQSAEGWTWAATYQPYLIETRTLAEAYDLAAGGEPRLVLGPKRKAGPSMGHADEAAAKADAASWIRSEVSNGS